MADVLRLTRAVQVGIKEEAEEGTPETLDAADFALGVMDDADITLEVGEFDTKAARGTFSPQPMVKGARMGGFKGKCYLQGGSATVEPKWGEELRAGGFRIADTAPQRVAVGARTGGEFQAGDVVGNGASLGASTATAMIVAVFAASAAAAGTLFVAPLTGNFANADTIRTFGPTVSCVAAADAEDCGREYRPFTETESEQPASFTQELRRSGEQRRLTGFRSNVTLSLRFNEPAQLDVEGKGAPVLDANGRWPVTGQMAGVPSPGAVPLPSLRLKCRMGKEDGTEYRPVLTEFSLNLNNQVTPRGTFTDADYAGSGYRGARISGRRPSAKVNPESAAELDATRRALVGTLFKFSQWIGSPAHGNGLVVVYGGACQFTGGAAEGDRDGIRTVEPEVLFTGDQDDEVRIFHLYV